MSITSDLLRGHTDSLILAQLNRKDSYGYEINRTISAKTDGRYELKEATLYTAFKRLEEARCIRSYWGDEMTGARRKYYAITPMGKEVLEQHLKEWERIKQLLDGLLLREDP